MPILPFLLAASLLQDAQPNASGAAQGPSAPWRVVDAAILIVNEDIITVGALSRQVARRANETNARDDATLARIWQEVASTAVSARLRVQAGRNMGFDEAQVDRYARDDFQNWTERQGGVVGLTRFLDKENLTVDEFKEFRRDLIYQELWENSVTGEGASVAARPSRDRFVRPGKLRFEYERAKASPTRAESIGGRTEQVDFERVLVPYDPTEPGAAARAKDTIESLRARLIAGENMERVLDALGIDPKALSRSGPTDTVRARKLITEADEFLASARPGDVSEPIAIERKTSRGWILLRIDARQDAEIPALADIVVQRKIADASRKEIDEFRKELARRQVEARSYIWQAPPPEETQPAKK